MKMLMVTLSYLFSGLELLTNILVFPLALLCGLGLMVFTLKIARDLKSSPPHTLKIGSDADRLPA
jgi:hypothetical protein